MTCAEFAAHACAGPERDDDLPRAPRVPLPARGRVRPPDRKVVRQVAVIHRSIRTHSPTRCQTGPEMSRSAARAPAVFPRSPTVIAL